MGTCGGWGVTGGNPAAPPTVAATCAGRTVTCGDGTTVTYPAERMLPNGCERDGTTTVGGGTCASYNRSPSCGGTPFFHTFPAGATIVTSIGCICTTGTGPGDNSGTAACARTGALSDICDRVGNGSVSVNSGLAGVTISGDTSGCGLRPVAFGGVGDTITC